MLGTRVVKGLLSRLDLLVRLLPSSSFFEAKRRILNLGGHDLAPGTRVVSLKVRGARLRSAGPCHIGHGFRVYGAGASSCELLIGAGVDIGPEVVVFLGTHAIGAPARRAGAGRGTNGKIGDGVWVGGRSQFIGPFEVGAGAVVGAGTTVRHHIEDNSLVKSTSPTIRKIQ